MRLIYTLGIHLYGIGLRLAALCGHRAARLMVRGWRAPLPEADGRPTAWFHAASLGEFEQARPVLEAYRQRHPECRVVVTFFSPSGYEVRKNYGQADALLYLPLDTRRNARRLVEALQPKVAFFVKYDYWYNTLAELHSHRVPTYIFSAIYRPQQYFFRPWGRWFLRQLGLCFDHIFVQNEASLALLRSHGIEQCSLAGDTRFDRVDQIARAAERDAVVERFLEGYDGAVLVGGSTWPPDEQLLASVRRDNGQWFPQRLILAPHMIGEEHLQQIERLFPDSVRYSVLRDSEARPAEAKVLIIDNIGLLSKLYRYATVAYIGGGFGVGIHNILEAVTFGKPVFFGPNYTKFQEAHDAIARGGGWAVADEHELASAAFHRLLTQPQALQEASQACMAYMRDNLGSTDKILNTIEE